MSSSEVNQRLASLHEARDAFFKALKVHEHTIYKLGYEDGYSAGWEAALSKLAEIKPAANFAPSGPTDLGHLLYKQTDETSTQDTLLDIIKTNPGLKRQEIVEAARRPLPTLNERTVRTALQRMKNAGELQVVDSKWYPTEKQSKVARQASEPAK
jgi:hypothetical protein